MGNKVKRRALNGLETVEIISKLRWEPSVGKPDGALCAEHLVARDAVAEGYHALFGMLAIYDASSFVRSSFVFTPSLPDSVQSVSDVVASTLSLQCRNVDAARAFALKLVGSGLVAATVMTEEVG